MSVIEWIDRHDLDAARIFGQTVYGDFEVTQPHGGKIVATFTARKEGGGTFTARSPQPTWADAVVWCDRILADLRAGGTDRIRNYAVEEKSDEP